MTMTEFSKSHKTGESTHLVKQEITLKLLMLFWNYQNCIILVYLSDTIK